MHDFYSAEEAYRAMLGELEAAPLRFFEWRDRTMERLEGHYSFTPGMTFGDMMLRSIAEGLVADEGIFYLLTAEGRKETEKCGNV